MVCLIYRKCIAKVCPEDRENYVRIIVRRDPIYARTIAVYMLGLSLCIKVIYARNIVSGRADGRAGAGDVAENRHQADGTG